MTTCTCNPTLIRPSASPWTCSHGNTWRLGVPGDPYCWTLEPRLTPGQAKANADAAFAIGALCGALGAGGREIIGTKIQRRFEEVIAAQEADDHLAMRDYDDHRDEYHGGHTCPDDAWRSCERRGPGRRA